METQGIRERLLTKQSLWATYVDHVFADELQCAIGEIDIFSREEALEKERTIRNSQDTDDIFAYAQIMLKLSTYERTEKRKRLFLDDAKRKLQRLASHNHYKACHLLALVEWTSGTGSGRANSGFLLSRNERHYAKSAGLYGLCVYYGLVGLRRDVDLAKKCLLRAYQSGVEHAGRDLLLLFRGLWEENLSQQRKKNRRYARTHKKRENYLVRRKRDVLDESIFRMYFQESCKRRIQAAVQEILEKNGDNPNLLEACQKLTTQKDGDLLEAQEMLEKNTTPYSPLLLGLIYSIRKRFQDGFQCLSRGTEIALTKHTATGALGWYFVGWIDERIGVDQEKAFECFSKTSQSGDKNSEHDLRILYGERRWARWTKCITEPRSIPEEEND